MDPEPSPTPDQDKKPTPLAASALVRGMKAQEVRRAFASREKAQAKGHPLRPVNAPRLWQRWLVVPLMTIVQGVRGVLVWVRDVLTPPPPRILEVPADEVLIVGHRGACIARVENTIESFEHAVERESADAVEIDLCVTKDGQVAVWHDWDPGEMVAFARQAGAELRVRCRPVVPPEGDPMRKPVCELTLQELREHYGYAKIGSEEIEDVTIPVLADVVRWAHRKPRLRAVFLDCKVPPGKRELIRVIAQALKRALDDTSCRATFVFLTPHLAVMEEMKSCVDATLRSYDVEVPAGFLPDRSKLSAVARARAEGNAWCSIGRPLFTIGGWWTYRQLIKTDLGEILGAVGTPEAAIPQRYVCWTINRRREMRHLLRMGVHGILTDYPAVLRDLLERKAKKDAKNAAKLARAAAKRAEKYAKKRARKKAKEAEDPTSAPPPGPPPPPPPPPPPLPPPPP